MIEIGLEYTYVYIYIQWSSRSCIFALLEIHMFSLYKIYILLVYKLYNCTINNNFTIFATNVMEFSNYMLFDIFSSQKIYLILKFRKTNLQTSKQFIIA